jgi:hypothetical protein
VDAPNRGFEGVDPALLDVPRRGFVVVELANNVLVPVAPGAVVLLVEAPKSELVVLVAFPNKPGFGAAFCCC